MKRHWIVAKKIILFIILMPSCFVFYSAFATPVNKALQKLMDDYTRTGRMPGIVVGIIIDDAAPFYLTSGFSNIQTNEVIRTDSLFKFGSTLKTVTAIILLNKLKAEKIPLNVSIEEILNTHTNSFSHDLRELSQKYTFLNRISIIQLLNHTSQLVDEQITATYLAEFSHETDSFTGINHHLHHSLARGLSKSKFEYANVNYILLGKIIEILYNKPFNEVINEEVFNRLNLKNAHYYYSQSDINKWCSQQAHAYEPVYLGSVAVFKHRPIIQNYRQSQLDYIDLTCAYDPSWDDGPAGALLTNPIDMATLAQHIFSTRSSSFAKNYWEVIQHTPENPDAKVRFGAVEMNYRLGIWQGRLSSGLKFWRLIGEQWGFSGGAIFLPKQKEMHHAILLIYAINTDQPKFLEGNEFNQGFISHALQILEKT